ncbi:MAG: MFS transporter [Dehalococcoidia bacterium]
MSTGPAGRAPSGMGGPPGGEMSGGGALPITGWRQTFSSLSGNRDFKNLFIGNVGFFFGMNMMIILRGWLVQDKWDNASYLGFIMASVAIPMLVLSPIAGVVTDRVDRRKLLLVAQGWLVVINSIVAVLIITDDIQFWHLLVVSTLTGAAFAFNMPGRQALVATLVPRDRLMNAMALSTATMNISRILGPAIGAVLIGPIGIGGAYVVSTAFFLFATLATFVLPPMPSQREKQFTFVEDFVGGFSYIKQNSLLMGLMLFATVPMIFAMPYMTLLPVFADRVWHVGENGFGAMQAASGFGGLIGALIIANLDSYPKKTRLLVGGAAGFGGFLVLFALSPSFYLGLFLIGLVGFASMVVMTVNNTSIQLVIPDEMRGRVMSVMMMTFGLMPLGAVPAGVAAEGVGVRPVVVTGGLLCIVAMFIIVATVAAFRRLDDEIAEGQARQAEESRMRPDGSPSMAPGMAAVKPR